METLVNVMPRREFMARAATGCGAADSLAHTWNVQQMFLQDCRCAGNQSNQAMLQAES
jgi:hypothetical protein